MPKIIVLFPLIKSTQISKLRMHLITQIYMQIQKPHICRNYNMIIELCSRFAPQLRQARRNVQILNQIFSQLCNYIRINAASCDNRLLWIPLWFDTGILFLICRDLYTPKVKFVLKCVQRFQKLLYSSPSSFVRIFQ